MRYQLLVSKLDPADAAVPQYEKFSPVTQDFLMQLRTLCDSVLHTYLSKIADTPEKRNYLHVLYTALDGSSLGSCFEGWLHQVVQHLELYSPTFQPCAVHHLLFIRTDSDGRFHPDPSITNYLSNFIRNPERSRSFYRDPEMWSTLVATRCMRHLRTRFNPARLDIRSGGSSNKF